MPPPTQSPPLLTRPFQTVSPKSWLKTNFRQTPSGKLEIIIIGPPKKNTPAASPLTIDASTRTRIQNLDRLFNPHLSSTSNTKDELQGPRRFWLFVTDENVSETQMYHKEHPASKSLFSVSNCSASTSTPPPRRQQSSIIHEQTKYTHANSFVCFGIKNSSCCNYCEM